MLTLKFTGDKDTLHNVSLSLSNKWSLHFTGLSDKLTHSLREWVNSYMNGTPQPFVPSNGSPFQTKVWAALARIPFGTTVSYQQLAQTIGSPRAVRAVGTACGQNPFALLIPCHRVIRTDGSLGGFAYGLEVKQALLDFERTHSRPLK